MNTPTIQTPKALLDKLAKAIIVEMKADYDKMGSPGFYIWLDEPEVDAEHIGIDGDGNLLAIVEAAMASFMVPFIHNGVVVGWVTMGFAASLGPPVTDSRKL